MIDIFKNINFSSICDLLAYDANNPLLFNTGLFLFLFLCFLFVYQLTKKNFKLNSVLVILFSLYFYYKSSEYYCFIMIAICLSDYIIGRLLGEAKSPTTRKLYVALNVVSNIAILLYFKYFNLLLESFASIRGVEFDALDIVLPAGISFITFRSMSYIIDIYRKEIEPEKSLLNYTFFLSFFPPLLAGPVVRAKDLLPQIRLNQPATKAMIGEAFFMVMCGLIKKVVIADYIGVNFVDRIFDNPALYTGFENIMGILGYTIQIYCDFSGYSDMAIGIALILGYRFKENFNAPYKSQSPSEFWHRWHISLSTWLKDYLYIPLGGNRNATIASYVFLLLLSIAGGFISLSLISSHGYIIPICGVLLFVYICYILISVITNPNRRKNITTAVHLIVTMLIGGLWHGPNWMFAIWGIWTSSLMIIHKKLKTIFKLTEAQKKQRWRVVSNIFFTFILMSLSMVIFRAPSIGHMVDMFTQITTNFAAGTTAFFTIFVSSYPFVAICIFGGYIMHFCPKNWTSVLTNRFINTPIIGKAVIFALVLFLVIQTRQSELIPFIYQQY